MKTCSCGKHYTLTTWKKLEYVGEQGKLPYELEMRNCTCGSTIAVHKREKTMATKIRILVVQFLAAQNGAEDEVQAVEMKVAKNDLKAMQDLVGGYLEHVRVPHLGLDMWVNEEGVLQGLPLHRTPFYPQPIAGNFFLTRTRGGDMASLTDKDVRDLKLILSDGYEDADEYGELHKAGLSRGQP